MADQLVQAAIREEIQDSIDLRVSLLETGIVEKVESIAGLISAGCAAGGKVLVFGNGGSAADAQHVAAEFVGRFRRNRRPLPALALSADIASVTAVGNDYDFAQVFERQVMAHGRSGDVAIGLSTSGNSENVIRAIRAARRQGLTTVGISGERGRLKDEAEHAICLPSPDTARVQEGYMLICHIVCEIVERTLFETDGTIRELIASNGHKQPV